MKQLALFVVLPISPKRADSVGQSSIPAPKIAAVKQKGVWHILIDSGPKEDTVIINKIKCKGSKYLMSYVICIQSKAMYCISNHLLNIYVKVFFMSI